MTSIVNQIAYLKTTSQFPIDSMPHLAIELDKSYVDIANAVNNRTIGLFPVNRPAIGGESWFVNKNQRQQNLRQVFPFSDTNLTITHGIKFTSLTNFVRIWGTFFDGTNWQCLPYVDVVASNNQINVKITATQIIVTKGAGAPPACNSGLIVVEWISNP